MTSAPPRYAVFVSPHGYGHAARASGVMAALHELNGAHFEIFTTAPLWFFQESVDGLFNYHEVVVDVGFRQASALRADLPGTVAALDQLLPFDDDVLDDLAARVRSAGCVAVVADVAPMGVAVAERAGVPSVVVENFSWSWLYAPYLEGHSELRPHAKYLAHWRACADMIIQTEPLCSRDEGTQLVNPISRAPRVSREQTRASLGVPDQDRLVVITMGGYGEPLDFLAELADVEDVTFVVTGARETTRSGNLRVFNNQTPIFMPDLMRASDAVVAKLGYGTISEVWAEGIPFGWVSRPDFSEMPPLERFVERELQGFEIQPSDFAAGVWIPRIRELLELPRTPRTDGGGGAAAKLVAGVA